MRFANERGLAFKMQSLVFIDSIQLTVDHCGTVVGSLRYTRSGYRHHKPTPQRASVEKVRGVNPLHHVMGQRSSRMRNKYPRNITADGITS